MNRLQAVLLALVLVAIVCATSPTSAAKSPCDTVRCRYGGTCVNENGRAKCSCDFLCTDDYKPVCGSNGKTYSNACNLRAAACYDQKEVRLVRKGEC